MKDDAKFFAEDAGKIEVKGLYADKDAAVNKAIDELVAEGFMTELAAKYDMSESLAFK